MKPDPMELAVRGLSTFTPTGRRVLELFYYGMVSSKMMEPGCATNVPFPEHALAFLGLTKDVHLRWISPD
jgi:hypothetical protein